MSNPPRRKTRVRLVPTIHPKIEKTKCRPRPRLATGDESKPRRGVSPTTTTSKGSIRRKKNSKKPTIDANRGCAKSGVCCGRKEFRIVGLMPEGEGS